MIQRREQVGAEFALRGIDTFKLALLHDVREELLRDVLRVMRIKAAFLHAHMDRPPVEPHDLADGLLRHRIASA